MMFKADLHIHSYYSDGRASPREIIAYAVANGLSIISITDHNTFQGSIAAMKIASSFKNIMVIPGVEVRTDEGDILVYCYEEFDFPRRLETLLEKARENNCLIVPAHPFDVMRLGIGDRVFDFKGWSAIEVWNAGATTGANRRAVEAARLLGLPSIANSDAHIVEHIGVAYTLIEAEGLTLSEVFEAVLKGRVRPIQGRYPFRTMVKRIKWGVEYRIKKLYSRSEPSSET